MFSPSILSSSESDLAFIYFHVVALNQSPEDHQKLLFGAHPLTSDSEILVKVGDTGQIILLIGSASFKCQGGLGGRIWKNVHTSCDTLDELQAPRRYGTELCTLGVGKLQPVGQAICFCMAYKLRLVLHFKWPHFIWVYKSLHNTFDFTSAGKA